MIHSNGIAGNLGKTLDAASLTTYSGPFVGYVLTLANALAACLSGDTGITAEPQTVVRDH